MIAGYLIDSNATASPVLRAPGTEPIYLPVSVLLETYKHANIPRSVEESFGFLRSAPDRVHVLRDFGSLSQHEIRTAHILTVADVVDQRTTAKIRQALSAGIGSFHDRHQDIIQRIKHRQETLRHGLLNTDTNRIIASDIDGNLLARIPDQLRQPYRVRSRSAWLNDPIDKDLVEAAVFTARREMHSFLVRRGFPRTQRDWLVRKNPLLFRALAIGFVRRFVNESGNTMANWQRNPSQQEFTNERIDLDVCALSSLFRIAITNDTKNRICLRYLHRIMEINRRTVLTPTRIVYAETPTATRPS